MPDQQENAINSALRTFTCHVTHGQDWNLAVVMLADEVYTMDLRCFVQALMVWMEHKDQKDKCGNGVPQVWTS